MSLKRKLDDQQSLALVSVVPPAHLQTSVTTTAAGSFMGFPTAVPSAVSVFSSSSTKVMQMNNQNSHQSQRLRAPSSAVTMVQQEDVRNIAGI